MGWDKIKDAGKGVQTLWQGVANEALEQAGTQLSLNGKLISKTLVQSSSSLKQLAFKDAFFITGEAVAREGFNKIADALSGFALDQFKQQINEYIQNKVEQIFHEPNLNSLVRKMSAVNKQDLKAKIERIVMDLINPEHNFWKRQWNSLGDPLMKGILSDQKYLGSKASMGFRILGTLRGMHEITFIIEKLHEKMLEKLSELDKQVFSFRKLLKINEAEYELLIKNKVIIVNDQKKKENVFKDALHHVENVTLEKRNPILCYCEFLNPEAFENETRLKSSIRKIFESNKEIIEKLENLQQSICTVEISQDLSEMIKKVSDVITDQIIRVIQSDLISPWSSLGVGALTAHLSNSIQDNLIKKGLNVDLNRLEKELKELEGKETLSDEDKLKLAELKADWKEVKFLLSQKQNYTNLTYFEADKFISAHTQCSIIGEAKNAGNKDENQKENEKVKQEAEAIENGAPADIAILFAASKEYGFDLFVTDDPDYQLTDEQKRNNTKVVLFIKDPNGGIGHYQLLGSEKKPKENDSYDCGFECIQEILKEKTGNEPSVKDIRKTLAGFIKENSATFSRIIDRQDWIASRYQDFNGILLIGGYIKKINDENNPIKECEIDDETGVVKSVVAEIFPKHLRKGTKTTKQIRIHVKKIGGKEGDHAGHIVAKILGGSGNAKENIFPQNSSKNTGEYREIEKKVYQFIEKNPEGYVEARYKLVYEDAGNPTRPTKIELSFVAIAKDGTRTNIDIKPYVENPPSDLKKNNRKK